MKSVTSKTTTIQFKWLDLIRGLAALAVFSGHLRILIIKDTPLSQLDVLGKGVFFITGFGHIAVDIFFVLSGFLIIKSIHESFFKNKFSVGGYANNRLSRLWVVLIPALILGLIFDKLGVKYYSDTLYYSGQFKYFYHQALAFKLSPKIFLGNLFFLQTIIVPTLGSNGVLWTLANEFWYYLIFPFFYFSLLTKIKLPYRLSLFLIGVLLLFFVGKEISLFFLLWLGGGLSYIIYNKVNDKTLSNKYLRYSISLTAIIFIVLLRSKYYPIFFNNYTVGLIFALLVPLLTKVDIKSKVTSAIAKFLSDISYTLYLTHLPFLTLMSAVFYVQGREWNNESFLIFTSFIILVMLYSTFLWYLFERNTWKVRKLLSKKRANRAPQNCPS